MNDLEHATAVCGDLGETFCLTFVKGVDEAEALRRMGALPGTVADRTGPELRALAGADAGFPLVAAAIDLGRWSVVIEPGGVEGAHHPLLEAVSRGTEALSVLRHGDEPAHVGYAVDATTVVAFDPGYPAEEVMWGSDPGLLRHLLQALGLREPAAGGPAAGEPGWEAAVPRSLVLAQRLTGSRMPADPLGQPRSSAQIEPWFVTPTGPGDLLRSRPRTADLVAAAVRADPRTQRAVAAAEVARLAGVLGIADTPGLTTALDAAAAAPTPPSPATPVPATPVPADSPLGGHVRVWSAARRRAACGRPGPHDAARADAYGFFLAALRGVLDPDPRTAVLAALRPLGSGPEVFADDEARASVLRRLAGKTA